MISTKRFLLLASLSMVLIFPLEILAQLTWETAGTKQNFYDTQKDFNEYWKDKNVGPDTPKELRGGWKQFKRWEWFWEQRVYPTGEFPDLGHVYYEYLKSRKNDKKADKTQDNDTWEQVGPKTATGGYTGLGRLNCVIEHPDYNGTTNQEIWVGAASGGIWKTTNNGSTWTKINPDMDVLGIADILINPDDPDIIYVATGDGDGSDTYSIGVLKSTDGGSTWNTTGFQRVVTNRDICRRLEFDHSDYNTLFVATNDGLYKSTDGGANFTQTLNDNLWDVKVHPTDADIVYATGATEFYKSTDNGDNFTQINSGTPTGTNRLMMAISPDEPNYVYILASESSGSNRNGYKGVWRSTNSGTDFTSRSTTPNLLGWYSDGSDQGGQGWYDLTIVADPSNADILIVGGVNMHRSTDGGQTWTCVGMWTSSGTYNKNGADEVHADHHMLYFPHNNRVYTANDGGLDFSTNDGDDWTFIGSGLEITQFYRIGVSQTNSDYLIGGAQDNSSFLKDASGFKMATATGDGFESFIDYSDNDRMMTASYYGNLRRSLNGGQSFSGISLPNDNGAWLTPYVQDPNNADRIIAGYIKVWESTDFGNSWTQISNFSNSYSLSLIHVAPANSDYIFAGRSSSLWKTTDGGANWSSITVPTTSNSITYMATNYDDPNEMWITYSGYSSGQKVYHSTDGGDSWTNISGSLPNVPFNTVIYQRNTNDVIYVGGDIGVWYRDADDNDWTSLNSGLPNVIVNELEIRENEGDLIAGTYGRGMWEIDLPINNTPKAPTLVSPAHNAEDVSLKADLTWNAVDNADSYTIQIIKDGDINNPIVDESTTDTKYNIEFDFLTGFYSYQWRVKAINDGYESSWSELRTFKTEPGNLACVYVDESFESTSMPTGWTEEDVAGNDNWAFGVVGGAFSIIPSTAMDGTRNALLYDYNTDGITRLITPMLEIGNCSKEFSIEFWESRYPWDGRMDVLKIKFRHHDEQDWTTLETYDTQTNGWTKREISFTPSDDFYVCFEGESNYTYGLALDDVVIFGRADDQIQAPTITKPTDQAVDSPRDFTYEWDPVANAQEYNLQISESQSFTTLLANHTVATTSKRETNHEFSTLYYARVRAYDGSEYSDWSSVVSHTIKAEPMPPTLVAPANNASSIAIDSDPTLSWNSVAGTITYQVQVSTDEQFSSTVFDKITTQLNIDIPGLEHDTKYYWRVRSFDGDDYSDYSAPFNFTTEKELEIPNLLLPIDNASNTERSITFSWDPANGAINYQIQISLDNQFGTTLFDEEIDLTNYEVSNLDFSLILYWRVRSENAGEYSDWSEVRSLTVKDQLPAVTLNTPIDGIENQNTSLPLTWLPVNGANDYDVQLATDNGFQNIIIDDNVAGTTRFVNNLTNNRAYYWRVRATDGVDKGLWSAIWDFKTEFPAPNLATPANNSSAIDVRPQFTWNSVDVADSYQLQVATDAGFNQIVIDETSANIQYDVINNLAYSTTHHWRVRAKQGLDLSDWSSVWQLETEDQIAAPNLVSPLNNAINQDLELALDWDASNGAIDYHLLVEKVSDNSTITDIKTNGTLRQISGLEEETEYRWRVRGENNYKLGEYSPWFTFTTGKYLDPPAINSPNGVNGTQLSVNLDFEPSLNANEYRIQVSTASNFATTILDEVIATDDKMISNLNFSTLYFWRVMAKKDAYESDWSVVANFTTKDQLPAVTLSMPADDATDISFASVNLSWFSLQGAVDYQIQVSKTQGFGSTEFDGNTSSNTIQVQNLENLTEYFWRVRGNDGNDNGLWSPVFSFTTEASAGAPVPWTFTDNTGTSHTIDIPSNLLNTLGDRKLINGDAIGAYFNDGGVEKFAGYIVWNGNTQQLVIWGDNLATPDKDGFSDGEEIRFKVWDGQKAKDYKATHIIQQGDALVFTDGASSNLEELHATVELTINIAINTGWNMISSNIIPPDTDIEVIFQNIENDILLVKNGSGQIFAPGFGINDIVTWDVKQGYQVYATSNNTLDITGQEIEPENTPLNLSLGWNLIAYLRSTDQVIADALIDLENDNSLLLAKNNLGQIYAPGFGIDDIGIMQRTQGYQVYLTKSSTLTYDANSGGAKIPANIFTTPRPKSLIAEYSKTGLEMTLFVKGNYSNETEVGVYDKYDNLIGSAAFNNGKAGLTIWGDNPQTESKDGAVEGEYLTIKILNDGKLQEADVSYIDLISRNTNNDFIFKNSAIVMAELDNPFANTELKVKPNPAQGEITVVLTQFEGNKKISIYDINGKMLISKITDANEYEFDINKLPNGEYLIEVTQGINRVTGKFIKMQ